MSPACGARLVTVPLVLLTVSRNCCRVNTAMAVRGAVVDTLQFAAPNDEQSFAVTVSQPVKVLPVAGVAWSATVAVSGKLAVQVVPQSITLAYGARLATVPLPLPVLVTTIGFVEAVMLTL